MSELKAILSERISGNDVKALAGVDFKEELFQLLFDEDKRTSDNAAWVMTHLPKTADAWLAERQNALIDEVMRTESTTKRRLIMNLLERTPFEADHIRTDCLDFCSETYPSCAGVFLPTAYRLPGTARPGWHPAPSGAWRLPARSNWA